MATVTREKNGTARVWFVDGNGKRKGIRIGKVADDYADRFKSRVEDLLSASVTNSAPREETAMWVMGLSEALQNRLAAVGLIAIAEAEPAPTAPQLGEFVDAWMNTRNDVKESTKLVFGRCRRWLVKILGASRRIDLITEGDADDWQSELRNQVSENTARKMAGVAKQIFRYAVRKKLVITNPFADLVTNVRENSKRNYTVSREEFDRVVEQCPDAEWRLIAALSRFGGLRIPSEIYRLKWEDINLQSGRFTIHSPKTEHHQGGESRVCPIFPELRPFIEEALLAASDGNGRIKGNRDVIERHRMNSGNLSTQFRRFIRQAGLAPWEKLFHNMRATRQTELENDFPTHVVCNWLGNSPRIASRHYLRVTEEHIQRASTSGAECGANQPQSGASSVQDRSGHNRTQQDCEATSGRMNAAKSNATPMKNGASETNAETPFTGRTRTRIPPRNAGKTRFLERVALQPA